MANSICRSVLERNFSHLLVSNKTTITEVQWITSCFSLFICCVAFIGNIAALSVIFTTRGRSRFTHDKYLANLAIADLLRTCFIPFTVIARMKRNFIFGKLICQLLPIIQGVGVSVDIFTLVSISIERYLAICHPFIMLKLKSMSYSSSLNNFVINFIWIFGCLTALPNFYMHDLCFLPIAKRFKCERIRWESLDHRIYIIGLDLVYFGIPLTVMIILHTLILIKISKKNSVLQNQTSPNKTTEISSFNHREDLNHIRNSCPSGRNAEDHFGTVLTVSSSNSYRIERKSKRDGSFRIDRQRRKVSKLLLVLIVEFFICWIPLYIYQTVGTFDKNFHRSIPSFVLDAILLFSFASAASNPLTYHFMSKRYRTILYEIFTCSCHSKAQSSPNSFHYRTTEHAMITLRAQQRELLTPRRLKSNPI